MKKRGSTLNSKKRAIWAYSRFLAQKILRVWAVEGDCDPGNLASNSFEIEWPPESGQKRQFPEVDRGDWFDPITAEQKITKVQRPIIEMFYGIG